MPRDLKDENGVDHPYWMGCYGVGITRSMQALVEQHHDDKGIIWPLSVAPYHVIVTVVKSKDETQLQVAYDIEKKLEALGYLKRERQYVDGKITDWIYYIYDEPYESDSSDVENPENSAPQDTDFQDADNLDTENLNQGQSHLEKPNDNIISRKEVHKITYENNYCINVKKIKLLDIIKKNN